MLGEVIGINTAIFSPSGGSIGIGFSIPSGIANGVIKQLVKYGKTRRGWLGVRIQKVTEGISESLGLKKPEGALVASVSENSPAAKGGIRAGDVILKFNSKPIKEMRDLPRVVAETDIDKKVDVEIWRNDKKIIAQVSVGELDEEQIAKKTINPAEKVDKEKELELSIKILGMSVSSLSDRTRKRFNLKNKSKGVVIVAVNKEGVAAEKNIKAGDIIMEVSQNRVGSPADVKKHIDAAKESGRKSVLFLIDGNGGLRFVALRLTEK
jgi:serine protease Do